jgi:predicted Zn-dependent protease
MSRASRFLAAAAALAAVLAAIACSDIAAPVRSDLYEWRLEAPAVPGPGLDTLSFHWSRNETPVRIWVEDAFGLPDHMERAIDVWESAFLYGELDATLVSDSATADVIVRGGTPEGKLQRLRLHSALRPECAGVTDLDIDVATHVLRLPVRVFVNPRSLPDDPGIEPCLALTSIHELGHAIGIFAHSDDPEDIMYVDPEVDLPSNRDISTAEAAYHTQANLQAVRP